MAKFSIGRLEKPLCFREPPSLAPRPKKPKKKRAMAVTIGTTKGGRKTSKPTLNHKVSRTLANSIIPNAPLLTAPYLGGSLFRSFGTNPIKISAIFD